MSQALERESQQTHFITLERTSEQIKAEIRSTFGFVPPFFEPATETPQVLESLWQQTLSAYLNNPLPALFKEKLSTYLSRFCAVPYCMVCHSCTLRPLGMTAGEVLKLLETPPPAETDINEHLTLLATHSDLPADWPTANSQLEESLLHCSVFLALREASEPCRQMLHQILGSANYQHLIALIAYIKTCHVWMEAHPEVVYEADQRVIDHLGALLEEEPDLAEFFRNYQQRIRREGKSRAEQLVELAEYKRQQQQVERERLVSQIAQRIRQSLKLEEILSTTVSQVRQFLQTDRVFIYRFEPDWGGSIAVESVVPGCSPILGMWCRDSIFAESSTQEAYKQGRIYAVEDIYTAGLSPCHLDLLAQLEVRANLVVPIVQGETLWGLLVANHCSHPRQWESLEIDLLKHLATQVAIAIQQSTLFEQVQTELSERKQAEQKIREQAALLDVATDAILVEDLERHILFWNNSAQRLYGWHSQEILGQKANTLLYRSGTASPPLSEIQTALAQEGKWQGELQQVTKDDKDIIVESRWTLVQTEMGHSQSILVVNTDITEKKLLERQFLRAQRMESLGTLASGIAHDFNNILTPILAGTQLLPRKFTDIDEQTQQLLKTMESSAKRGAALVKQVLSFARGVDGQRTILQVQHLLLEIEQIVKQTFPKSIEVYTDLPRDLWFVYADSTQLHQVLMNLVVNARDAMPNGGVLSLAATNIFLDETYARMNLEAQVGSYVVITISDTGTGIAPEIVDRIFEPFFTTKELGKGTGLGLSSVMGILKSHGGFVNVSSEVSTGTQFKVFLPAMQERETLTREETALMTGAGELILVVDDEAPIREITKTSLEAYNYQVLTASDGIEAIALYAKHQEEISVVLMDMMMPSMDGQTTIRTLQKINPQVKIIAFSGLTSNNKLAEAVGVKTFLSKPYTTQGLLNTLNNVLRK